MSTSLIYHTQGIIGFQHKGFVFSKKNLIENLERKKFHCTKCLNSKVTVYPVRNRIIQGLPYGNKSTYFNITVHQIYCPKCKKKYMEEFDFLSHPKARVTKQFERTIVELRKDMTISAISRNYNVPWARVKEIDKRHLEHKFCKIKIKDVKIIGIDELAIGHTIEHKPEFWTIVRDLVSGAVLHVDKGKGGESLQGFLSKLRRSKAKIELVAMDMSQAFSSWVKKNLPNAEIVFDHFHVIKKMNDLLDRARRDLLNKLDKEYKIFLKRKRFLFLRNREDLDPDALKDLDETRERFSVLSNIYMMKEALRTIYRCADNCEDAHVALQCWCNQAKLLDSFYLDSMVKCIQNHWEGILGFWKFDEITNASMEGFNNKVKTMIRQAYGFHDKEYMRLKIFNLPNERTNDGI